MLRRDVNCGCGIIDDVKCQYIVIGELLRRIVGSEFGLWTKCYVGVVNFELKVSWKRKFHNSTCSELWVM